MRRILLALAATLPLANIAAADTLLQYNFEPAYNYSPSILAPGLAATTLTSTAPSSLYYGNSFGRYIDTYGAAGGAHYEFSVTVPAGKVIDVNSLSFEAGEIDFSGQNTVASVQYSTSSAFTSPVTLGGNYSVPHIYSDYVLETASSNPITTASGTLYFRINFTTPSYSDSFTADNIQLNGDLHTTQVGDANSDGIIDLNDLAAVLNHFGQTTPAWSNGNFDGAPTIDATDLNDVLSNFGHITAPAAPALQTTSAPEPASLTLLTLAVPLLLKRRTRKLPQQ